MFCGFGLFSHTASSPIPSNTSGFLCFSFSDLISFNVCVILSSSGLLLPNLPHSFWFPDLVPRCTGVYSKQIRICGLHFQTVNTFSSKGEGLASTGSFFGGRGKPRLIHLPLPLLQWSPGLSIP